jgi:hypothetical protein
VLEAQAPVSNCKVCGHLGCTGPIQDKVNAPFGMDTAQPAQPDPASLRLMYIKHKAVQAISA